MVYYSKDDDAALGERARSKRASSAGAVAGSTRGRGTGNDPLLPEKKRARRRLVGAIALALAAAAPVIPWTSLVYAIAPNGRESTYEAPPPDAGVSPVGVFRMTVANAIFAAAQLATGPGQPERGGEPAETGADHHYPVGGAGDCTHSARPGRGRDGERPEDFTGGRIDRCVRRHRG